MGNTCKPMAVLFQCMTKFTTNKKKKKKDRCYIEQLSHCAAHFPWGELGKQFESLHEPIAIVGGMCDFLGSTLSQQKFEAMDRPALQPLDQLVLQLSFIRKNKG